MHWVPTPNHSIASQTSNFLTVMAEAEMHGEQKISIAAHAQTEIMHWKLVRGGSCHMGIFFWSTTT